MIDLLRFFGDGPIDDERCAEELLYVHQDIYLFEVTPKCEIVWEHVFAEPRFIQRAYRYGLGHCPQEECIFYD